MWCCSKQVTSSVVRQRRKPRLTATAQVVLSRANRLWQGGLAALLGKWRKRAEDIGFALLEPADHMKTALNTLVRRRMFGELLEMATFWRKMRHLMRLVGKFRLFQAASALNRWKIAANLREITLFTHKQRIRTVIAAIRQKITIEKRNSLTFWRKVAVKDRSFDVEAKRLSAIKLLLALKAVYRRALLSELRSKPNVKWALRRITKAFSKNGNSLLGKSVQLWRTEVDLGKNKHEIGLNRHLATIVLQLRLQGREMHREAVSRWKQIVPSLAFMRVNGKVIPSKKAGKAGKVLKLAHNPVSFRAFCTILSAHSTISSPVFSAFRGQLLLTPLKDHTTAHSQAQLRLLKRTFLHLGRSTSMRLRLALQSWTLAADSGRVQRIEYRHSAKALGKLLAALLGNALASGFREMKTPKSVQRIRKGMKALQRSCKYVLQKRFYQWSGSLKAFQAMQQLGALHFKSALQLSLKRLIFLPVIAGSERLLRERHHLFLLNRLLLKALSSSIQYWHCKALESGLVHFQTSLRLRRLQVLSSAWTRKQKSTGFLALKGTARRRELQERVLWQLGRVGKGQRVRRVMWEWRGKAKLLSRVVSGVRLIRRVGRRRSLQFFALLSAIAKTGRGPA